MAKTVWYLSKYVVPPAAAKVGTRGFSLLREFARLGLRTVLVTSDSNHLAHPPVLDGPRLVEKVDGVDVVWLRTVKYSGARSIGRILSWFDFEWRLWRMPEKDLPKPDVVIVSSLSLLTILNGLRLRRCYGCKLAFEIRDIWPLTLVEVANVSPRHPLVLFLGWIERLGYRKADLIVGTVPNLREHVVEVSQSQKPVVCVPQGIEPALLLPPDPLDDEYARTNFPDGKFIVCYAGTIGAANALDTLIACATEMADRPDIHFVIAGDGALKESIQKQTAALANITIADSVPKSAVQSVLQRADILYFAFHKAGRLRFGQSLNKMIDYMLSGKPVIASYSGFPSMINEAECGSFVPAEDVDALRDEIERYAVMSQDDRDAMGERGRAWVLANRGFDTLAMDYLRFLDIAPPSEQ